MNGALDAEQQQEGEADAMLEAQEREVNASSPR